MDTQIIAIQNVHGYVDEQGTVWLNAKDVAIGLGFVEVKYRGATSCANTEDTFPFSIRWRTIRKYLEEFGFRQEVGEGSFIPENMFYRLAMKARNETAERFQAKVADEILPQLRKTGMYRVGDKVPQTFLEALELAVEKEKQRLALEAAYQKEKERADDNQEYKDLAIAATDNEFYYSLNIASKCLDVQNMGRNKLFKFLRDEGVLNAENCPYQQYINDRYFVTKFNYDFEFYVTRISPKGMKYVLKKLVANGFTPNMTVEQWEQACRDEIKSLQNQD